ncbi:hypothetical protein [Constantimarinum furrinae]|uniref:Lipoprotein n=1 Tax=Constantimarinum furrinae TaxID=2562285 RepID=A0A7G8PTC7_9FLAO|nr:hypothetical protein [Constantimarinum furrinae]QNJ97593.1 hypothetical protein ALE3EI_1020 [Constantimarinum furrinae]
MKRILLLFVVTTLISCNSKDDDGGIACTEILVYGLTITVQNSQTNQVITEGITVTAIDGTYSEELMLIPGQESFSGAAEREGTYIITITGDNYENFTSEAIVVNADECHVIPEVRNFEIHPI